MVKYSFVIPVYNCEKYLGTCVESILNQEGIHSYEIILVDDGTKDSSGEVADELARQYAQIRTYHKENAGASSARNVGIREATGTYLLFIDGDDRVDKHLLQIVEQALRNNEQSMVVYGMSFDYYSNEQIVRNETLSCMYEGLYSVMDILKNYQEFFTDNALSSACNKVFLTEIVKTNGLKFKEGMTLYEDYEFVLRYLMHIQSVVCVKQPLYHYRNELEHVHLKQRVQDLEVLRANLEQLLETSITLNEMKQGKTEPSQLLNVSGNLYMQLLIHNLMVQNYTPGELKHTLTAYCDNVFFKEVLFRGGKLSETEQNLLKKIEAGNFARIYFQFKKRKFVFAVKGMMKRMLRMLKLRQ